MFYETPTPKIPEVTQEIHNYFFDFDQRYPCLNGSPIYVYVKEKGFQENDIVFFRALEGMFYITNIDHQDDWEVYKLTIRLVTGDPKEYVNPERLKKAGMISTDWNIQFHFPRKEPDIMIYEK
jgi:hypothetical protein